jgi:hypothetical protein
MTGPDPLRPPDDLRELDQALGAIRFGPRASLEAEIVGRARRGGQWKGDARSRRVPRRLAALAAAALMVVGTGIAWLEWTRSVVSVDRCCYDLDGGADPDDGVLVLAGRNEQVRRLAIYEDRDSSRSFTRGDVVRFSRGAAPTLIADAAGDLVTIRHCCLDFDGGGPDDDGLLVVGVPPDRVMMVALYEESAEQAPSGWPLR